jgi:hypothetical protein
MKRHVYILLLTLICLSSNAQKVILTKAPDVDSIFSSKLTGDCFYEDKKYIGEQFLNKDWTKGDILLTTGEIIHDKLLKYNGLFDGLVWMNEYSYRMFQLHRSFVNEFWIVNTPGTKTHFKRICISDTSKINNKDIYMEVKAEGKISFYIQRRISIVGTENVKKNDIYYVCNVLEPTPVYYFKLPSNQYVMMSRLRPRAFLKLFPKNKKAINKLIREKHLNVRDENECTTLIELMNKEAIF